MPAINCLTAVLVLSGILGCTLPYTTANSGRPKPVSGPPPAYTNIEDPDGIFRHLEDTLRGRIRRVDSLYHHAAVDSSKRLDLQRTVDKLTGFWHNITRLSNSRTHYLIRYTPALDSGIGGTTFDLGTSRVVIEFGQRTGPGDDVYVHEMVHALQYEEGRMSFTLLCCSRDALLYHISLSDISDETEAYRYAGLYKGNIQEYDTIKDKDIRRKYPQYDSVPDGNNSLSSWMGKLLKKRTMQMGYCNKPPYEFYKGWESDYARGCALLRQKKAEAADTGTCSWISRRN